MMARSGKMVVVDESMATSCSTTPGTANSRVELPRNNQVVPQSGLAFDGLGLDPMPPTGVTYAPERPPIRATLWRPAADELAEANSIEAVFKAHFAGQRGQVMSSCRSLVKAINEQKILRNRVALWRQVARRMKAGNAPATIVAQVNPIMVVLRELDIAYEHASGEVQRYYEDRTAPDGYRPGDLNKKDEDAPAVLLCKRPLTNPKWSKSRLQLFIDEERAILPPSPLDSVDPPRYRITHLTLSLGPSNSTSDPINAIDWYLPSELVFPKQRCPEDQSFIDAHLVGITLDDIRNARASNVQRVERRPAFVFGNRIVWLGPLYRSIEGQRHRRCEQATETEQRAEQASETDPILWPNAEGRTLDPAQHRHRLKHITGMDSIEPERLVETGLAWLVLRGATWPYLAHAQDVHSSQAAKRLEDLENRVLQHHKSAGLPEQKAQTTPPGKVRCICGHIQNPRPLCERYDCQAPLDSASIDGYDLLRWQALRAIDRLLRIRRETPADREEAYATEGAA